MIIETNLPNRLHKGKVRDTYDLGDGHLLMIATDRISAFDVVLPTGIPSKGHVLARMSAFWFHHTASLMDNHLVGMADAPEVIEKYKGNATFSLVSQEISQQSMVVKKAQRIDIECIVRGYLAGSAWAEYRRNGTVWGKETAGRPERGTGPA